MIGERKEVLYVGKAKNLKNRVTSYFRNPKDIKTKSLVSQIKNIEFTVTNNEVEALLLENQLIKQHKPKYNIIFRDDKTYPFIVLTDDEYSQLKVFRGSVKKGASYFGPYPHIKAVRETQNIIHKIFKLRQCEPSVFKSRKRPCLQYQIKRCSAPCTGLINKADYQKDLDNTKLFLQGNLLAVIDKLISDMDEYSKLMQYEHAARIRDQIKALRAMQKNQAIFDVEDDKAKINIDVLGVALGKMQACVHLLCIRNNRLLGSRQYFLKQDNKLSDDKSDVLAAFMSQHYFGQIKDLNPDKILLPNEITGSDMEIIQDSLQKYYTKKIAVEIVRANNHKGFKWLKIATNSAQDALAARLDKEEVLSTQFEQLAMSFNLEEINRVECFDVSHSSGEATVASCVVFDRRGPLKSDYRRFNIKDAGGDDYAAMEEALTRHYSRLMKEQLSLPDLLLIDGGKGQLSRTKKVLIELQLVDIMVIGVAKGPTRKAGFEQLLDFSGAVYNLDNAKEGLKLIHNIRDEAHRFAITGHRNKRGKTRLTSMLENIPGIGVKKRQDLLRHFGGINEVKNATLEELVSVPGINQALARRIFDAIHGSK